MSQLVRDTQRHRPPSSHTCSFLTLPRLPDGDNAYAWRDLSMPRTGEKSTHMRVLVLM